MEYKLYKLCKLMCRYILATIKQYSRSNFKNNNI